MARLDDPLVSIEYRERETQIWYNFMYVGAIADSENLSVTAKEQRIAEMVYQAKKEIEQQGE